MTKQKLLEDKAYEIALLERAVKGIQSVEQGRLYKINYSAYETWGILESFNKESTRFRIVASYDSSVKDFFCRNQRGNLYQIPNHVLVDSLTRAKQSDLPTLLALTYKSAELEEILKGKTSVKIDKE